MLPVGLGLILCYGFAHGMQYALTETGYAFLLILSLYTLNKYLIVQQSSYVFWFFFALGSASLFRPGLYLFTILIAPAFILLQVAYKRFTVKGLGAVLMGLLLTLGFQSMWMNSYFNSFKLTYIDDITWHRYGGTLAQTISDKNCISNSCFRETQALRDSMLNNMNLEELHRFASEERKNMLLNQPAALFKMMKINVTTNLISGSVQPEENDVIYNWTRFVNLFLSISPFIFFMPFLIFANLRKYLDENTMICLIFILAVIAYTIITSGISCYQGDRFHIPFYPLSLAMLSWLIGNLTRKNHYQGQLG